MKDLQQMAAEAVLEQEVEEAAVQMKKKNIKEFNEIELYFFIEECGFFCWRMNHDMADGRIPQKDHAALDADIVAIQKKQVEAIKELPRIGIECPLDEADRPTTNYWLWYRKWHKWHLDMSSESWDNVNRVLTTGITNEQLTIFKQEVEAFVPDIKAELERQKAALTMEKQ
jgi:hypothetical protein